MTTAPVKPPSPQGWWAPDVPRPSLQKLMKRKDLPGLLFFAAWLIAVAAGTWLLAQVWGTWWVVPVLILHGTILSFAYAASHEGAHGTAFKSTWLNETVFYLTSFVFGEEPMLRRYSHGRHHAYTWYPGFDSQMPYRNPLTLRRYLRETLALTLFPEAFATMWRHSLRRLNDEELGYIPPAKIGQLVWGSRLFLVGYAAIGVIALVAQSWFPVVAFFGARVAGGWVVHLFINSQHMCMNEAVPDHRYSTRSLRCLLPTRVLYWNMNYHIEHHLYPGVPFHALPATNRLIAGQLPVPSAGAFSANREILRTIQKQAQDPASVAVPSFSAR